MRSASRWATSFPLPSPPCSPSSRCVAPVFFMVTQTARLTRTPKDGAERVKGAHRRAACETGNWPAISKWANESLLLISSCVVLFRHNMNPTVGLPHTQALLAANSAAPEVAELLKLVCKTFWSATYMEIPPQLLEASQFGGWMTALHTLVLQPMPTVDLCTSLCSPQEDLASRPARKLTLRPHLSVHSTAQHQGSATAPGLAIGGVACCLSGPRFQLAGGAARGSKFASGVALVEGQEMGSPHHAPPLQEVGLWTVLQEMLSTDQQTCRQRLPAGPRPHDTGF